MDSPFRSKQTSRGIIGPKEMPGLEIKSSVNTKMRWLQIWCLGESCQEIFRGFLKWSSLRHLCALGDFCIFA